jgi:hypothetical protein
LLALSGDLFEISRDVCTSSVVWRQDNCSKDYRVVYRNLGSASRIDEADENDRSESLPGQERLVSRHSAPIERTRPSYALYADNEAAIRLYESLGFVREGLKARARKFEGRYQDTVLMALWP